MNEATPQTRAFARRLLVCEASLAASTETELQVVIRICDKLRHTLSTLAGAEGFRSLLERALTLARAEATSIAAVQINPDGSLSELALGQSQLRPAHSDAGAEILVAQILDLLILFVGQPLTLRFVQEIWPDILSSDAGPETEKT